MASNGTKHFHSSQAARRAFGFFPEEAPEALAALLHEFLAPESADDPREVGGLHLHRRINDG